MTAAPRQPDDPGIDSAANPYAPVVFGERFAELTPMADRDRRSQLPRSITATLMNDPPPGCSALDQKRAEKIPS